MVDLHVVVDDLRAALGRRDAVLAAALPPNVYYMEHDTPAGRLRAKYAVLSARQLRRACTPWRFDAYFWGRYAQPVGIVHARSADDRARLVESLLEASATFQGRTAPTIGRSFTGAELFERGLRLCYACELRAEGARRAAELVADDEAFYADSADAALADGPARRLDDGRFEPRSPPVARVRLGWTVRVPVGKALSFVRLVKALATFDGGVDYIVWKLERHSGRRIEVPERVRRRPLVHLWPLVWRLWREGVFR